MRKFIKYLKLALLALVLSACSDTNNLSEIERNSQSQSQIAEQQLQQVFAASTITINGKIYDNAGMPVENANVSLANEQFVAVTDSSGYFQVANLPRKNSMLTINADGFRSELLPIYLQYQVSVDQINVPTVVLTSAAEDSARLLFGGDTAFGRRFLDTNEITPTNQIPQDDPLALILASDPEPGTRNVVSQLRPYYQEADWGVVNFETPVTDNPLTPHPTKDFVFFTLPDSLPALSWLGVDYVSLGNNHVYDYLDGGIIDTISHLNNAEIPYSGAGLNSTQAFEPFRQIIKNSSYSFISMTSIDGRKHPVNYVAEVDKAGAADLTQSAQVTEIFQTEISNGHIPIAQYHTGDEYTFEPTNYVLNRIDLAAQQNVPLAIIHHPHVAQGVGRFDSTLAVLGLGNLAFDQARLETMLGIMARVDMRAGSVESVRLLPVYLENFAPKLISGRLADDFIRRLGEFSHDYGGLVYPYNGQGWVSMDGTDYVTLDREVMISIEVNAAGNAIVDLREWQQAGESVVSITGSGSLVIQQGRDLMQHGDFEDWDTDSDLNEAARWEISSDSRFVCMSHAYRDNAGLCSVRKSANNEETVISLRNRVRVMGDAQDTPNKDLSLFGYFKASNAGELRIVSNYLSGFGDSEFGEEVVLNHPGGSFDWQVLHASLNMPADVFGNTELDARAARIFIYQAPPESGEGLAVFDELALISWENQVNSAELLQVPHAKDFLKISASTGTLELTLKFRKHVPSASQ